MKKLILQGHSTYDGAGVKLKRIFAHDHTKLTDPQKGPFVMDMYTNMAFPEAW